MITDHVREKLQNDIADLAKSHLPYPQLTSGQLVEVIQKAASTKFDECPQIPEGLFRLANFYRVYPESDLVPYLIGLIEYVCAVNTSLDEQAFIVGKYLSLCSARVSEAIWFPLRDSDRDEALKIYRSLIDEEKFDREAFGAAIRLFRTVAKSRLSYPDHFLRDISVVLKAAKDSSSEASNGDARRKARAALQYLALEDDAIPDHYGYIGLTDDMYVIGDCARSIAPYLRYVDEKLWQIHRDFPFLSRVRLHESETYGYVISDYFTLTNSPVFDWVADTQKNIFHVTTVQDPTSHAVYGALYAALAVISKEISKNDFDLEEKVPQIEDYSEGQVVQIADGTKWNFVRVEYLSEFDSEWVVLTSKKSGDRKMRLDVFLTEAEIPDSKGRFRLRRDRSVPLNPIEQLFDLERFDYHRYHSRRRIFLVCNKKRYESVLHGLQINGASWKKALPIAAINQNLEIELLSGGEVSDAAALYLVPNLRTLLDYYYSDEILDYESLVIVDGSTEFDSAEQLLDLNEMGISCCVFSGEIRNRTGHEALMERGFTSFRWKSSTLKHFLPQTLNQRSVRGIENWEGKVRSALAGQVEAVEVESKAAAKIFASFRSVEKFFRRSEMELDRYVFDRLQSTKNITLSLLRLNTYCLADHQEMTGIMGSLEAEIGAIKSDRYLEDHQKQLFMDHLRVISLHAAEALRDKATIFKSTENNKRRQVLVSATGGGDFHTFGELSKGIDSDSSLIGFWPGQKKLARVLSRGTHTNLQFVLFEHEFKWFQSFQRNFRSFPTEESVYPGLEPLSELALDFEDSDDELAERADAIARIRPRNNFDTGEEHCAHATSLVFLEPDGYLFSTERSEFSVLQGAGDNLSLSSARGSAIQEGSRLVFLPDTERDAIRETADRYFLEKGIRETAVRWRVDLAEYQTQHRISYELIQKKLLNCGVVRGIETIKRWVTDETRITPTQHKKVIPAIYQAIGERIDEGELQKIYEAIEAVLHAHHKAAEFLTEKVRRRLETKGGVTEKSDIQVYEVIAVERCERLVPYRILSRPQTVGSS